MSLLGLPIAQFPQIIPPQINLTTTFTGADALTIEQSVATPIEQQMNGVDNMLYIQSTNANDGTMNQRVTFDVGTNIDIDNVLVQNRFSQAQTFLPQDVKNFGVTIKKSLAFPLIVVSLYSPDGRYDAYVPRPTTRSSTSTTRSCASRASATSATSARRTTRCASGSSPTCWRAWA